MITATVSTAFHPDHLADLARSGLTEDDARAAEIRSARPGDIPRLIGRDVPDGTSALVFPYYGCDGFTRLKIFPPIIGPDGKPIRYLQRAETGCPLYVPQSVAPLLPDPSHPLAITEGEKKSLAITKAGWPCVGIGGIWNFKEKGAEELTADLKGIPWSERIVRLIPDADVWQREDLLLAVYRLARLLEAEGATVLIVKLPGLPGIEKTGADDFLVAKGPGTLRKLIEKAVTLSHPAFRALRQQERAANRQAASAQVPAELADRRLHPALHYEEDLATVGVVEQGPDGLMCMAVTSERKAYSAEALAPILTTPANAFKPIAGRWLAEDRAAWLAGGGSPASFAVAIGTALALFSKLLDAPSTTLTVLAVWTVATYFFPLFAAFPRLFITGEKESGKSKAQQIIAGLAWNGLYCVVPTGPTLFRLIEAVRPTFCVSEAEHLDGDQRQVLRAVTNEGYKRGGWVPRCDPNTHRVETYDVYAPLVLGSITGLNVVTESRAITFVMQRGTNREKMNRDVDPDSDDFRAIRCHLYRLTLERFSEVARTVSTLADPPWLVGRERELWRPLLILAHLADSESGGTLNLAATIRQAAKAQTDDRAGPSEEAEALVSVLEARLNGKENIEIHPGDLVEELKAKLHREYVSSASVGHLLKRNGFQKPPKPGDRDAGGVIYLIRREQVEEIRARYAAPSDPKEQPTNLHTSKTYTTQPIDNEQVAASNVGM